MLRLTHARTHAQTIKQRSQCSHNNSCRSIHIDHSIYVSKSLNPYFNLSLEDWLFRHKPTKEPLLLLYRDNPCVVIGRNQNPWKEVNLRVSNETGTPWIRRRSGGGTVYHDLGNTNFSIHLPRATFDRNATAQIVLSAVRSLGIDANVNDRNDICVGKDKICSAYKIVNNRAYHHGTMLISTQLDKLGDLLRTNKDTMRTKGVPSVRSPVRNLQQYNPSVTHEKFIQAVVESFREEFRIDAPIYEVEETEDALSIGYIQEGMAELPRWDWAFGQTPEFTYTVSHRFHCGLVTAKLHSKHGIILDCMFECPDAGVTIEEQLASLGSRLKGQKYAFVDEQVELVTITDPVVRDIWYWIKSEMEY